MRRSGLLLVVLVTALVLQTSLLPALAIAGYRPDLLLLITTVVALRDGGPSGLRVGAAAGLMTDLVVSDAYLGISVITGVVVAYGVAAVRPYLTSGSPVIGPAGGAAAALGGTGTPVAGGGSCGRSSVSCAGAPAGPSVT